MFRFTLLIGALFSVVSAQDLPALTVLGAEGDLNEADFPLLKCQGDCNRGRDCAGNLMCFNRGGATTIPGCSGRAPLDGTDFCWDPTDKPLEGVIAHVGNNGNPAVLFPLQRCAGQCSEDSECQSGLVCLRRSAITDPVWGCEGPLLDRTNYCVNPTDIPGFVPDDTTTDPVDDGSVTDPVDTGDDTDDTDSDPDTDTTDPADDGSLTVGGDGDDTNIEPLMNVLTIMYLGNVTDPSALAPLEECHGNCALNVDCAADLVCFNRTDEPVPGCGGILLNNVHYCVKDPLAAPLDDLELDHPSLEGKLAVAIYEGFPYESIPLKQCQGDCKSHTMCDKAEGLSCYKRDSNDDSVPGCTGVAVNDISYCVKTEDLSSNTGGGSSTSSGSSSLLAVSAVLLFVAMAI